MLRLHVVEQRPLPRQLMPSRIVALPGAVSRGLDTGRTGRFPSLFAALADPTGKAIFVVAVASDLLDSARSPEDSSAPVPHTPVLQKSRTKLIVTAPFPTLLSEWMGLLPHLLQPWLMRASTESLTTFAVTFSLRLRPCGKTHRPRLSLTEQSKQFAHA
jgi:hypothetical protein